MSERELIDGPAGRVTSAHLRRRLYPMSKAVRNNRRIMRRMRYYGGGMPPIVGNIYHRRRSPCSWIGIVNMILQRRAKARKVRR